MKKPEDLTLHGDPPQPRDAFATKDGRQVALGDALLGMSGVAAGWGRGMAASLLRAAGEAILNPGIASASQTDGLHRLIYVSRSTAPDASEAARRVASILAVAQRENAAVGLTGALVYSRRWFAQVLEGERAEVDRLFARIKRDPRHRNIHMLSMQPVRHRAFRAWSMAAAGEAPDHLIRRALESLSDQRELTAAAREISALMRNRLSTGAA